MKQEEISKKQEVQSSKVQDKATEKGLSPSATCRYRALFDYQASRSDELSCKKGDIITVSVPGSHAPPPIITAT